MKVLDDMIRRAARAPKHIVLTEGLDPRIVDGAVRAIKSKIASITLLGPIDKVRALTKAAGDIDDQIRIVDPKEALPSSEHSQVYFNLRQHKGIKQTDADIAVRNPLNFANLMVQIGEADGSIAGATYPTSDIVRSALQIIGTAPGIALVSSFFLMGFTDRLHDREDVVVFADCGLVVSPNEVELAEIASTSADSATDLLGISPKIAMLSFSTHGSASHPDTIKMSKATHLLALKRPDLSIDGELQFDAAFVESVAQTKAPESDIAGHANIYIFPDLNAGNIGYKIAERIGGMQAIGPILQGLNKPANDLSRGCTSDDIYKMIAITVLQASD